MNVLALVTDAFGGSGGIAQYNRDLITALAGATGATRIVVLPRLGIADRAVLPAAVSQSKPHRNQITYSLAALAAAVRHRPYDFVYCGHLYLAPLGALLAKLLGVPLWLQLHGWEAWEPPSWSARLSAEQAQLITAVSRHTRRQFLSFTGIDPGRVRVLPNTVDARFGPGAKPDRLLDRFGLRGRPILLTVGRLDPDERRKGHDKVIAALPAVQRSHPDVVYLVVGHGEDRARLEALAESQGVAAAVVFAGEIAAGELPQVYRMADLFVMPSTQEGFGIVFLEAAASGLRVVAGNVDGSRDALADGAIGTLVDPADTAALASAIVEGLAGRGPDPAGVRRFGFDNFAAQVHDVVSRYLLFPRCQVAP